MKFYSNVSWSISCQQKLITTLLKCRSNRNKDNDPKIISYHSFESLPDKIFINQSVNQSVWTVIWFEIFIIFHYAGNVFVWTQVQLKTLSTACCFLKDKFLDSFHSRKFAQPSKNHHFYSSNNILEYNEQELNHSKEHSHSLKKLKVIKELRWLKINSNRFIYGTVAPKSIHII